MHTVNLKDKELLKKDEMDATLISVLIPCRNHGAFLADCLDSIGLRDSYVPTEVIVVDDGSDEDIEKICAAFDGVKYIRQEHRGVSAARNRLLEEASGEYIAFLDADDLFVPGKLRLQLDYLLQHPECPYVNCNVMSFHGTVPSSPYLKNEPADKFLIPCLFRKSVFEETGPFDESLVEGEDTEYLMRIQQRSISGFHCLGEVLYLRRLHENKRPARDRKDDLHDLASSIIRARKNAADLGKRPVVSMIVPCYNAEPYVAEFLQSVTDQTYRPLELIIVDDGSTDGTGRVIIDFLPLLEKAGINVHFIPCEHRNQSAALNEGLKYCTGKYLTWADCDDILFPENIAAKAAFLEAHPETGMVRNAAELMEGDCRLPVFHEAKPGEAPLEDTDIFEQVLQEQILPVAGCFMMRFSLFLDCWPEGEIRVSSLGQNLQLILPAAGRSRCGYIPEILMTYRMHSDSHSRCKRTTREVLERIEELRRVLMDGIMRSGRDVEKYSAEAEERCSKLRQSLFKALRNCHRTEPSDDGKKGTKHNEQEEI